MQTVELAPILQLLLWQSFDAFEDTVRLGYLNFILAIQFAIDVAPDLPNQGEQGFQCTLHAPVLPGMSVMSYLDGQSRGLAVVILAQLDAQGHRQFHQILPAGGYQLDKPQPSP